MLEATPRGATINTDEWGAHGRLSASERTQVTVRHAPGQREGARDEDGDGIREVHVNTIEGLWTGLRNYMG